MKNTIENFNYKSTEDIPFGAFPLLRQNLYRDIKSWEAS